MKKLLDKNSTLIQEASSLFDIGIPVFLSDPVTKQGIAKFSAFNPILDRDVLVEMCNSTPGANLEVVLDREMGTVALCVHPEEGLEAFELLCSKHGGPETLSYQLPNGEIYYLFRPGTDFRPKAETGMKLLTGTDSLLVYPSQIEGRQVIKLSAATKIQDLADWMRADGSSGAIAETREEKLSPVMSSGSVSLLVSDVGEPTSSSDGVAHSAAGIELGKFQPATDPRTALAEEFKTWIAENTDKTTILTKALEWNQANADILKTEEIVVLVENMTHLNLEEAPPLTPRDLLFKLAESMILFNDDQSKPYFFYEGEAFSAPSVHVKNRLTHHYLTEMKDLPPAKELKAVLNILESRARFDGPRLSLFNRVALSNGGIHYDLRDKRYIKITPNGWEIIRSFPLFRRYQHMQPQVEPISGGDPWDVFDYLTVPEESRLLVMVYIVSLFIPRIAHPVFAVCGDQGSSKSFFCSVINRLVDPTLTERVIQPKNERDLIQTLRQKYVTVLDNLSKIDNRVSDIFCQVCTGGSISYRQLYTDEGENIAQFRHVVILNSINLAIVNADLMDRSIILKLRRIDPLNRKPEHELWDAFENAKPHILGGIFDTVVKAMALYPTIMVDHLPRLADFAKWGYAIAEALGMKGEQFVVDFIQNVKRQNESVVEKNVLCQAVLSLMAEGKAYLAKVSDAHALLKSIAKQDARDETFPKLPHNLRGALERLRPSLLEHGIKFEFMDREVKGVKILISKLASADSPSTSIAVPLPSSREISEAREADAAVGELPLFDLGDDSEVIHV